MNKILVSDIDIFAGAIDAAVVTNVTNIVWNKVVEFAPFSSESNVSSYLQWAIPLSSISVSALSSDRGNVNSC